MLSHYPIMPCISLLVGLLIQGIVSLDSWEWRLGGENGDVEWHEDCRFNDDNIQLFTVRKSSDCEKRCRDHSTCDHWFYKNKDGSCHLFQNYEPFSLVASVKGYVCGKIISEKKSKKRLDGLTTSTTITIIESSMPTRLTGARAVITPKYTEPTTTQSTPIKINYSLIFTGVAVILVCVLTLILSFVCFFRDLFNEPDELPILLDDAPYDVEKLEYNSVYEISQENLEIGKFLGKGFFGHVYEGTLDITKQWNVKPIIFRRDRKFPVAVKTFTKSKTHEQNKQAEAMLWDELKIMCTVGNHPNIVSLVGAITTGDIQVIVERCENNLKDYLVERNQRNDFIPQYANDWTETEFQKYGYWKNGRIPISCHLAALYFEPCDKENWSKTLKEGLTTAHLLSYAMQIARGMEFLASRKMIHRDLAARNVLMTSNGICKVCDFGLAKSLTNQDYYRQGTVQYLPIKWMAPEAIEHASFKSDIWSYAIVLIEIFNLGEEPYPQLQMNEVSNFVKDGGRCDLPLYCHIELYEYMKLCWSENPQDRPSFSLAIDLIEKHLFIASKKISDDIRVQLATEKNRQRQFASMRNKADPNYSKLPTKESIPLQELYKDYDGYQRMNKMLV